MCQKQKEKKWLNNIYKLKNTFFIRTKKFEINIYKKTFQGTTFL